MRLALVGVLSPQFQSPGMSRHSVSSPLSCVQIRHESPGASEREREADRHHTSVRAERGRERYLALFTFSLCLVEARGGPSEQGRACWARLVTSVAGPQVRLC